jgi:hypothetical protein
MPLIMKQPSYFMHFTIGFIFNSRISIITYILNDKLSLFLEVETIMCDLLQIV